ncbi:hypothetical protein HW115_09710 [Verrucomicrobiaceae bacterium N1E253]|uniref:Leucyl aminopeptidase (Aminopeptidase T) n=1 Tax=Oceaniferula marina TaxID=2748318 RepID=A0A851GLD1_9BACT|nr:hypothetical protein [Oceaniferula marina]
MPRTTILDPAKRAFPPFSLTGLLGSVFEPTQGCKVCILIDFDDPQTWITDYAFVGKEGFEVQNKAYDEFFQPLENGPASRQLGFAPVSAFSPQENVALFAYRCTHGSNLDLKDEAWNTDGQQLSLERDIYPNFDLILCISTFSATAPLTEKCKIHGFRGATMHGLNDVILESGLAVNYDDVSSDAEKVRQAMTEADAIEIDFGLEDGRVLTAWLGLEQQAAQKSHGLCKGKDKPDIANLPAGEVYFVPTDARGQFPMKYEDGTLGVLDVEDRNIIRSSLIEGKQSTIDEHNQRLTDDPMTGTIGELGFGTQVLPVSGQDIQDEKVLGTCHLATGRDDHLGGDIIPSMFKKHENSTHDDILFAPHKTPNFNIQQVRMKRGDQEEIIIEDFRPSEYILNAMGVV